MNEPFSKILSFLLNNHFVKRFLGDENIHFLVKTAGILLIF